jgi:tripartite-type tricarboxylate transporter receptor subunit TctC
MISWMMEANMIAKRSLLVAMATAGCGLVAAVPAIAQLYPQRPVKIVVDRPAGNPHDLLARAVAEKLSARLKQIFVVENRPGAGGNLAAEFVARSAPDGHTLLVALNTTLTVNPTLYQNVSFNPLSDFQPISIMATSSSMLVVHPSVPADSVAEFIAYAKSHSVNYAHGGNGSPGHLAMEYFRLQAAFPANPVPYRGNAQLVIDLVAGQIKSGFVSTAGVLEHVRAGRLKGLAISSRVRAPTAPDVPTIAEAGFPDFRSNAYFVILAPTGISEPVAMLLEREVRDALKSSDLQERFRPQNLEIAPTAGAEARARMEADTKLWAGVIKATGMRAD